MCIFSIGYERLFGAWSGAFSSHNLRLSVTAVFHKTNINEARSIQKLFICHICKKVSRIYWQCQRTQILLPKRRTRKPFCECRAILLIHVDTTPLLTHNFQCCPCCQLQLTFEVEYVHTQPCMFEFDSMEVAFSHKKGQSLKVGSTDIFLL